MQSDDKDALSRRDFLAKSALGASGMAAIGAPEVGPAMQSRGLGPNRRVPTLKEYAEKYPNISMERRDGILLIRFHTDGGPFAWSLEAHRDLGYAFDDIGSDTENRLVIMTGTGDRFLGSRPPAPGAGAPKTTARSFDAVYWEGKRLLTNLLEIPVPMISAVNGPATIHAELPLLCDIVLASEQATFQDAPHFPGGTVPGDGVHVVWPLVLGANRGRYFLLTGQKLSAQEALKLGVISEVVSRDKLLSRARELAEQLAKQPPLTLRYARVAL